MGKVLAAIIYISLILFLPSCSNNNGIASNDIDLECEIISPSDGSTFTRGDKVEISVETSHLNNISYVQFQIDDEVVLRDFENPFIYEWDTSSENFATHTIKVSAMNHEGETAVDMMMVDLEYGYIQPPNLSDGWDTSTLENENMEVIMFADMMENYIPSNIESLYSILVIRNGKLVFEEYFNGMDVNSANHIHSASKSFTSALIGIAIDKGYIAGINTPMMDYFSEFEYNTLDTLKYDIRIEDLLTMSAGFDWRDSEENWMEYSQSPNWVNYVINLPLFSTPGQIFNYSTVQSNILSVILSRAAAMSTKKFAEENLFGPLGISIAHWYQDPQGNYTGGHEMYFTPRNMARFGLLYLNKGIYNGKRLISESWIENSTMKRFESETYSILTNGIIHGYGSHWWVGSFEQFDYYFAFGKGGQYIIVIPSLKIVIVTTLNAESWEDSVANSIKLINLISDYIIAALVN